MNKRKAFNFYRSFYDVYKELNEKQAKEFIDNLLAVEFLEKSIDDVVFKDKICSIVWSSIKHSVEAQIKGYAHKTGLSLENNDPTVGGTVAPYQQGEGEGEEKGQLQLDASDDATNEIFSFCWDLHSDRLKEIKTKSGNPRRNSKKPVCREKFLKLAKKYKPWALAVYIKNSTYNDFPKEFLNLVGRDFYKELVETLSAQDDEVLDELMDKNCSKDSFIATIEIIENELL